MATSTLIKEGWFFLPTFFKDDKYEPTTGTCTLLFHHFAAHETPSGRIVVRHKHDGCDFPDEDAMYAWIEEHDAQPCEEFDGNPRFVPEEFRRENLTPGPQAINPRNQAEPEATDGS